jgi:hypothetical protein
METRSRTLAEHIEEIALRTGAAPDFIEKVGFIFSSKGIALSENAGPYADLVEETFLLDEAVRLSERRALEDLDLIAQDVELARGYLVRQIEELTGVEETLDSTINRGRRAGNVLIFPSRGRSH